MTEYIMCAACNMWMNEDCGHRKNALDCGHPVPCRPEENRRDQAIVKLCDFYFSEWGAAKSAKWEQLSAGLRERKFGPESFQAIIYFLCGPAKPESKDLMVKRILEVLS